MPNEDPPVSAFVKQALQQSQEDELEVCRILALPTITLHTVHLTNVPAVADVVISDKVLVDAAYNLLIAHPTSLTVARVQDARRECERALTETFGRIGPQFFDLLLTEFRELVKQHISSGAGIPYNYIIRRGTATYLAALETTATMCLALWQDCYYYYDKKRIALVLRKKGKGV